MSSQWYLVQCKPRQEMRAQQNLELQGGQCLNFQHVVEKVVRGELAKVRENLFPGYVFLKLTEEDPLWFRVRSTYGVSRIVAFGGRPLPVTEHLIRQLIDFTSFKAIAPRFKEGQQVRIAKGAFAGLEAIFKEYDGQHRAVLLIRMLQKMQQVKMPLSEIG